MCCFICCALFLAGQDTPQPPENAFARPIYNPETHSVNFSYDYSNRWDLDGDKKMDSLYFIGNGGAHTFFFLRVILSCDHKTRDFRFIQLDMPFPSDKASLDKFGKDVAPQFVPYDFNGDGVLDLYLNFNNHFGSIPGAWKNKGIRTRYVVLSFNKGQFTVRDY